MEDHYGPRGLPEELRDLGRRFGQACWDDCAWLRRNSDYGPSFWEKALRTAERAHGTDFGAVAACESLIRRGGGKPQSGYLVLLEIGQVERSVEYAVLRPEWRPIWLYYPGVTDLARSILRRSGITPPDEDLATAREGA